MTSSCPAAPPPRRRLHAAATATASFLPLLLLLVATASTPRFASADDAATATTTATYTTTRATTGATAGGRAPIRQAEVRLTGSRAAPDVGTSRGVVVPPVPTSTSGGERWGFQTAVVAAATTTAAFNDGGLGLIPCGPAGAEPGCFVLRTPFPIGGGAELREAPTVTLDGVPVAVIKYAFDGAYVTFNIDIRAALLAAGVTSGQTPKLAGPSLQLLFIFPA